MESGFATFFGERAGPVGQQSASEGFSDLPTALGAPSTYWFIGGIDADRYAEAERSGRVTQDIPVNHSATFAPVIQPTLDTGTQALVVAALAWLAAWPPGRLAAGPSESHVPGEVSRPWRGGCRAGRARSRRSGRRPCG
ncbi:hypothetical protein SAMN06272737_101329 [Blastococcus mobilis]|uniref:Uncharacterized protein n=1 Tax=Blastococcus mobilis TaxID=1938746 RepID=A0A238UTY0_9ACTN|nr:hypothetical protein SAMN06272737_101329 [Blastococcus mobilis]